VNVNWLYAPVDLFGKAKDRKHFGIAELFKSNLNQNLTVGCIYSKIKLLPFDEYYAMEQVDGETFYYRGFYDSEADTITPPLTEWKTA
jgi:hypothetical protein